MGVFAHTSQNTMSTYVTVGWDLGFELFSWVGPQAEFRLISLAEVCCGFDSGYSVCGHQVVWHRLTGAFVACNRRYLKSWVGNFSEGPF
jgi:hypothetical protein